MQARSIKLNLPIKYIDRHSYKLSFVLSLRVDYIDALLFSTVWQYFLSAFSEFRDFLFWISGVDGTMVIVLKFSGNRMAVCTCSITMMLTNDAVIIGSKGTIKVWPSSCPCFDWTFVRNGLLLTCLKCLSMKYGTENILSENSICC